MVIKCGSRQPLLFPNFYKCIIKIKGSSKQPFPLYYFYKFIVTKCDSRQFPSIPTFLSFCWSKGWFKAVPTLFPLSPFYDSKRWLEATPSIPTILHNVFQLKVSRGSCFSSPVSTVSMIIKCGSRQPLLSPHYLQLYCNWRWIKAALSFFHLKNLL